ncbi:hypothetical protein, partial [Streptomyces sp. DH12]|uniref:hypothetical protein n=1 Tax=Streptomyces sp. DH12 TaxID=2857010 RepID=UPI001E5FA8FD
LRTRSRWSAGVAGRETRRMPRRGGRSDHDWYSPDGGTGDEDGDEFDEDCDDESDDEESHRRRRVPTTAPAPAEAM